MDQGKEHCVEITHYGVQERQQNNGVVCIMTRKKPKTYSRVEMERALKVIDNQKRVICAIVASNSGRIEVDPNKVMQISKDDKVISYVDPKSGKYIYELHDKSKFPNHKKGEDK